MNISDYKYKTELHAHTSPVSPCSDISPEEMVDYYTALGYSSVVITNHYFAALYSDEKPADIIEYYLSGYRKTKEIGEKAGLSVILGAEVRFPENCNDYLVYGLSETDIERIFPYLATSYEEFYKTFSADGRVILQAHPFRNGMELQRPELLDGIEVFNCHPNHNSRIGVAARYAAEHPHFIKTCGSDFHHRGQQGMTALLTKEKITDSFQLARVLKSRDYLISIGESIIIP